MAATQRDTLRLFTALLLLRRTWAGTLLAGVCLNDAGRALALASLAAGAAAIFLEDDPANLRAAQREGCCTFTVSTLGEALRIAKNEVRQQRAITVALRAHPAEALREMVERGVQPQAFAAAQPLLAGEAGSVEVLCERGMRTLHGMGLASVHGDDLDLERVLEQAAAGAWVLRDHRAASLAERRHSDAVLLDRAGDEHAIGQVARDWLRVAPSLFPRALERCCWERA